jgi:hypothetical protein
MSLLELSDAQKIHIRSFQIELDKETDINKLRSLCQQLFIENITQRNSFTTMLGQQWGIEQSDRGNPNV